MCGLPLWVIQGLVTGLCSCGLAIPLLFVKGNDAMVFLIVAATSLSLVSMLTSYYLFGRFMNGLSEELQRMRSPDDIPLSLWHMAHHLTPLCRVREAKVLMKHLEATLSRTWERMNMKRIAERLTRSHSRPLQNDSEPMLQTLPIL